MRCSRRSSGMLHRADSLKVEWGLVFYLRLHLEGTTKTKYHLINQINKGTSHLVDDMSRT